MAPQFRLTGNPGGRIAAKYRMTLRGHTINLVYRNDIDVIEIMYDMLKYLFSHIINGATLQH